MSALSDRKIRNLVLPPHVSGKVHGYLDIKIEKIRWTTTKKFSEVEIKLKWWGESEGISVRFNSSFGVKSQAQSIRYQVNTNYRLLQSYLTHSEAISAQIFSIRNKDQIGSASIEISPQLHNLEDPVSSVKGTFPILSLRNFKIGEMTVSFGVSFNAHQTLPEKENQKKVTFKLNEKPPRKVLSSSNKENIVVVGVKKPLSVRQTLKSKNLPASRKPINQRRPSSSSQESSISDATTNSSLMNYLTGRPISNNEESLSDLIVSAPIESITITVNSLELNFIGQSEVRNFIDKLQNQKCTVKCAVTSKFIKQQQADDSNFISYVFDTAAHNIEFRKKNLKLDIHSLPDDLSHTYLNFGFCLKSIDGEIPPFLIGLSRINFKDVVKGIFLKKCSVVNESGSKIGLATININYLLDDRSTFKNIHNCGASQRAQQTELLSSRSTSPIRNVKRNFIRLIDQKVQTTSYPSTSNDCENSTERRDHENKNVQTNETRMRNVEKSSSDMEDQNHRDTEMIDVELKDNRTSSKVYHVAIFIESLKNMKDTGQKEYFITYEGFWNQCQESTETSVNYIFNYLKQSPIMCDDAFLKRVQNNHLELKLWERTSDNSEKLVGCTRVALHQFYIAFKDAAMIDHLSTNKLPIISTDSWCNFISPLSSELFCHGKILLAIGNEHQVDYLIMSRDLHRLRPPCAEQKTQKVQQPQESQRFSDTNAQLKSKLSAFIESLSQKLPEPSGMVLENQQKVPLMQSSPSNCSSDLSQRPQLRKTSDLLDSLQKALTQQPTNMSLFAQMNEATPQSHIVNTSSISQSNNDDIRMVVGIDSAANLPTVIKKIRNKRNKSKASPQQRINGTEFEPISYVTFEASIGDENQGSIVKSHEGNVYCTKVVKGCHPVWSESFDVGVSFDVLRNPQKKFVVKVWRKAKFDQQVELKPAPFEDAVIGFSAIDLSALLTGLPILSGYYNIVDFSGRTNGQIKLSFKPLQDVATFRSPSSPLIPLSCPLNIDVNCMETSEGNSVLSRTLKRKFTELDEITQRLKARLFDVTGDENLEVDDEFERDLNTAVDDEGENFDSKENFGWLAEGNDFQDQLNKILESHQPSTSKGTAAPSTSTLPTHREISGCSSSDEAPPLAIDHLLKKYDLDTLINPNIFKNIIDPNIANSDSTPTLVPLHANTKSDDDESGETTVSSIISNDQVLTIEKALQRTSLHEASSEQVSVDRKDPDGEQHISE